MTNEKLGQLYDCKDRSYTEKAFQSMQSLMLETRFPAFESENVSRKEQRLKGVRERERERERKQETASRLN